MSKILVVPSRLTEIEKLNSKKIDGLIFSIENLSVNNSLFITMDQLKRILPSINPDFEICISLNKIMHNKDLEVLEQTLKELSKLNVSKIFFYDLSVLNISKRLKLKIDLVVSQDHLNASLNTNNFYYNRGIKYSLITNDITLDEVLSIKKDSPIKIIMTIYGYLPIFYSRRYLISSYLEYINKSISEDFYYIKDKDDYYLIKEEENGTTIYTKNPINLINYKDKLNILDYVILNSNYINVEEFNHILDAYINNKKIDNTYEGFINTKTIYKVKNNEQE